jgi:Domain of unknown function (DUF1963)
VWPHTEAGKPLSLVGQLNCDEINEAAGDSALPVGSVLAFFYEVDEQLARPRYADTAARRTSWSARAIPVPGAGKAAMHDRASPATMNASTHEAATAHWIIK